METLQAEFRELKLEMNTTAGKGNTYSSIAWFDFGKGKSYMPVPATGKQKEEDNKKLEMLIWFAEELDRKEVVGVMNSILANISLKWTTRTLSRRHLTSE